MTRHSEINTSLSNFLNRLGLLLLFLQLPANIWYTGGWLGELLATKLLRIPWHSFGPVAFGGGVAFSLWFVWFFATII